jgi:phage repressor protein C with HTH and peptisase S24 domain
MTRIEATELFIRAGQTVKLRAFGHSMTPAIASGDAIIVEPVMASQLRVGDVVLCRSGRHFIAHRIAQIAPGPVFLLRDDQTGGDDGWFETARVLGRVREIEHQGARRPVVYRPLALSGRRFLAHVRAGLRKLAQSPGLD